MIVNVAGISTVTSLPAIELYLGNAGLTTIIPTGLVVDSAACGGSCNVGINSFQDITFYIPDITAISGLSSLIETNTLRVGFNQPATFF